MSDIVGVVTPVALVAVAALVTDMVDGVRKLATIVIVSVVTEVRLDVVVMAEQKVVVVREKFVGGHGVANVVLEGMLFFVDELVMQIMMMMAMVVVVMMMLVVAMMTVLISRVLNHVQLVVELLKGNTEGVLMVVNDLDVAVLERNLDSVKVLEVHAGGSRSRLLGGGQVDKVGRGNGLVVKLHHGENETKIIK